MPAPDPPIPDPGLVFAGRYRTVRSVKRGNGVETFLGFDQVTGDTVVIKTVEDRRVPPSVRLRLEHEAHVLRQLRSTGVAPLLCFDAREGLLSLVMAYVPGLSLEERLRQGPLSLGDTLTLGAYLFTVLREAHDQGVLHRDIKPANIIVTGSPDLERATLIDFGLSRSDWLDATIRDQPVGTARYLSPEQAGLLDQPPDNRSDLYSAGVVLFECLAGRPPFEGETVGDVLRQHLTVRPPPLRALRGDVPRVLDELIQRLLRKDPRDRYQSAEGVLADLARLDTALRAGEREPNFVVGLHDRRRVLTEPSFVGRTAEIAALEEHLGRARAGAGGLALVEAVSGGGKTRLLEELGHQAARGSAWVLHGQGLDQAAQRPFQLLAGLAAAIAAEERRAPGLAQRLRERLGDQVGAVCAALPELREILGSADAEEGPESFGRFRVQQALAALLDALGTPERPALLLLDDCQWADESTVQLLRQWQRPGGQRHLLVVVAFRSEEVDADQPLRQLQAALHVSLPRFDREALRQLVESMAGPLPGEALDVIERLSEGSPFLAAAVLQGLVECNALVPGEAGGWVVDSLALADVQSSRHVASFLVRRIERLPPAVLALLSAGAVLGKEFDPAIAAALVGQSPDELAASLREARQRQLIWGGGEGESCAFVHDRLRQTFLGRLHAEERKDLHRRAALHCEQHAPNRVFDLAYHFDAAGESARALPYALAAAEQARAQHSLEVAEQQYRIARRGGDGRGTGSVGGETPPNPRLRVARGLGEVLMLRGRYDESARQFEAALDLCDDPLDRAQVEGKLGELAFKRDDLVTAGDRIGQALDLLGRQVPRWGWAFPLLVVWEALVQLMHTLLPRWFLKLRPLEGATRDLLAVRLYSRLAHLYWFYRGTVPALWAHLRGLNLAERYPPTRELAQAYSEHAPGMSLIGWFGRGLDYARRSLEIRRSLGDLWGQGQSLHYTGIVLYACSRCREAIDRCREAVRLLTRTGDMWEVNIARFQIAAGLYRLGRLKEAIEEAQRMYQSGLDLGDAQASGISLDVWSRASRGRVPPEVVQAELARPSVDVQRAAQVWLAEAVRLLHQGRPTDAARVLRQAQQRLDRAGLLNAWVSPVLPWLATAVREQAEQLSERLPRRRRALLAEATRIARRAHRLARRFRNELPHALRERGLLAALQGDERRALRYLDESREEARRQGAAYEAAQTRLVRAQLTQELGLPDAADELSAARQELQQLEAGLPQAVAEEEPPRAKEATLSLVDRFDTLLESGRQIASALSREAIFAAARAAALKLLRGERCLILKVAGPAEGGSVTAMSDEVAPQFSQDLVRQAVEAGRSVVFLEGASQESSESLVLSGARSVLCAPVYVRGQAVACFYLAHAQVTGLFGETERRLADFVATLTGAALENAEGFAQLRRLNETLEVRLQEIRQAQERIQEQAALLDKAQDAIAVLDFEDRILYWNRSAERLYGWAADAARGRMMHELLHEGAEYQKAHAAVMAAGEWSGELRQRSRGGAEVIVESRWTLVRDDQGRPRSLLVVSTDVTEKKRLEAQFLRAQRTESIGQLAGGIAHDMNNVLSPIILGAQLLRMGGHSQADQDQLLANIEEVALRGADMVKQILAFARGMEGNRVNLQLKHLMKELQQVLTHTFPKSIQLDVRVPRALWLVQADSTQLHQLLMNLSVNARDAMPDGGALRITAENVRLTEADLRDQAEARPGPYILLTVADTGTGIPPEVLERIFDPFFTTKEYGKGTGLGLSTVLGIAKGHHGFVRVESEVGRGTRMKVYLPAEEAVSPSAQAKEQADLPTGNHETILVVDDEAHVRDVTSRNLKAFGYEVLDAPGGKEAMEVVQSHPGQVRLVLTDLMMPGMDGRATIRALRRLEPRVPVVVMTGLPMDQAVGVAEPEGVQAVLQKPFQTEALLRTLKSVLTGGGKP